MTIEKYWAKHIKDAIAKKERGYQAGLAKTLKLERSTLNNYLSGNRGTTEDLRRRICKEMGLDYNELMRQYHESQRNDTALPETFKDGMGHSIPLEDAVNMMMDIMSGPEIYKAALMTSVKALFRAGRNEVELEIMKHRMDGFESRMEKMFTDLMAAITSQKGASGVIAR